MRRARVYFRVPGVSAWCCWNLRADDVRGFVDWHGRGWEAWAVDWHADGSAVADAPPPWAERYDGPARAEDVRALCSDCELPCYGPDYGFGRRVICGTCAGDYA